MKIALDYDGTFTEDPVLWKKFVALAESRGHEVICVTMRYPHEPVPVEVPCRVIYTSRKAKAIAVNMDVWIDDSPRWLLQDSA